MPRPRNIEPVKVNFVERLTDSEEDVVIIVEIPVVHFTWCFDLSLFGLAPVECCLGPIDDDKVGSFGGYIAVGSGEKEYFPEHEVLHFLESRGLDRDMAVGLLVETNGRNMNRVV